MKDGTFITGAVVLNDPLYVADLNSGMDNVAIGKKWATSETSVRRHKAKLDIVAAPKPKATVISGESTDHDTKTGVSNYVRFSETAWGHDDYREFIRTTGQDPDQVTFTWGWTSSPTGGFWNKLNNVRPVAGATSDLPDIDPVGILAQLRDQRGPRVHAIIDPDAGDSTFVVSINDVQLGQSYNGGSEATIKRFYEFIELAVTRITELRMIGRKLERIVFVFGGDLVEGCFIYPHQMRSIDLNRKKQIQGVVALILHAIDTLAPLFTEAIVLATKGNHGEHRENGKKIDLSDNDDTLCVEMAKVALNRDPDMQHIEWIIADEEAAVWADIYGWTLVTTHGDIYAKGVSGATTERKAHAWIKNMAAAFRKFGRIGRADVLITHHFHHDEMADWGDTLWRQTTSQDRGSPEFSQATGQYSEPGMLTGVMTPTHRWQDEAVLR